MVEWATQLSLVENILPTQFRHFCGPFFANSYYFFCPLFSLIYLIVDRRGDTITEKQYISCIVVIYSKCRGQNKKKLKYFLDVIGNVVFLCSKNLLATTRTHIIYSIVIYLA